MNGLARAGLLTGRDSVTVGTLLQSPRFGRRSLIDLMCVTEAARLNEQAGTDKGKTLSQDDRSIDTEYAWGRAIRPLASVLAAVSEFRGATTLASALEHDLLEITELIGVREPLQSIQITELTAGKSFTTTVVQRLETVTSSLPSSWRHVVEARLLRSDAPTLEIVGGELGVTRERVRQIQKKATKRIREAVGLEISTIASLLNTTLPPIAKACELKRTIERTFPTGGEECLALRLARQLLEEELAYSRRGGFCFNNEARRIIHDLRSAATSVADDVGLIDEPKLRGCLPAQDWEPFFQQLVDLSGIQRVRGRLALRNSGKAHVKAAVLEIGRAATKEEIAARTGMTTAKVGAHLSVIPSIARADKYRWGVAEWIDDIYEGIPAEIVQRIEEDGGATSLERLLEELPRLFGVSETSVRMYARTPYFVIHNGYVSVASEPQIALRKLDDVIDGRTDEGVPFWTFGVERRYFDGYSISPFPAELARELGCAPNGSIAAQVVHPPGATEISVNWPLTSTTGANVGRVADALLRLDVKTGDRVRLLVVGRSRVEFRPTAARGSMVERPSAVASDILERMKNRRQVF